MLSPEKCQLGFKEGHLLGHVVSRQGIKVDPVKVQRILDMKQPIMCEQVSQLWSMMNYHNRFIPDLAGVGRPFSSLISRTRPFV